jgi:hypothetical protein
VNFYLGILRHYKAFRKQKPQSPLLQVPYAVSQKPEAFQGKGELLSIVCFQLQGLLFLNPVPALQVDDSDPRSGLF